LVDSLIVSYVGIKCLRNKTVKVTHGSSSGISLQAWQHKFWGPDDVVSCVNVMNIMTGMKDD
jgi:hypothetical protein